MRYIINDDDFEDWIKRLKHVTTVISAGENEAHSTIEYVISEMEIELQQHRNKEDE